MKKLLFLLYTTCLVLPCIGMENNNDYDTQLKQAISLSLQESELQRVSEERELQYAIQASSASYHIEQKMLQEQADAQLAQLMIAQEASQCDAQIEADEQFARQLEQQEKKAPARQAKIAHIKATPARKPVAQRRKVTNARQRKPAPRRRAVVNAKQNNNNKHALPIGLQNRNFVYLPSIQQASGQCGHYSVFNAKAIQTLVEQGADLTADAIKVAATKHLTHKLDTKTREISELIVDYGQALNLENIYFIKYDRQAGITLAGVGRNVTEEYDSFFKSIWFENKVGNFICNTGGHWILFSIIKQEGETKPRVILLNSSNSPLPTDSTAYKVAIILLDKLGL